MLSVLRSLLAELSPSRVKSDRQGTLTSDRNDARDVLSAKRDPTPFGTKGVKRAPAAKPQPSRRKAQAAGKRSKAR